MRAKFIKDIKSNKKKEKKASTLLVISMIYIRFKYPACCLHWIVRDGSFLFCNTKRVDNSIFISCLKRSKVKPNLAFVFSKQRSFWRTGM